MRRWPIVNRKGSDYQAKRSGSLRRKGNWQECFLGEIHRQTKLARIIPRAGSEQLRRWEVIRQMDTDSTIWRARVGNILRMNGKHMLRPPRRIRLAAEICLPAETAICG